MRGVGVIHIITLLASAILPYAYLIISMTDYHTKHPSIQPDLTGLGGHPRPYQKAYPRVGAAASAAALPPLCRKDAE